MKKRALKCHEVKVRLTERERECLWDMALATGESASAFFRRLLREEFARETPGGELLLSSKRVA